MGEMRKITVNVPADLVDAAMAGTGRSLTETIREGLRIQANRSAWERLAAYRGKVDFGATWQELRGKDDDDRY
jgi:hypothetical protein